MTTTAKPNVEFVEPVSAAIIAAIIGAATAAACTTGSVLASQLSASGAKIVGDVANRTKWTWVPKDNCSATIHGHWGLGPQSLLSSWPAVKRLAQSSRITYEEASNQFAASESNEESVNDAFYLVGDGMGGESLAVYEVEPRSSNVPSDTDDYNDYNDYPGDGFTMVFYLKKISGGHYYGGIAVGSDFRGMEQGKGEELASLMRAHEDEPYDDPWRGFKTVFSSKAHQTITWEYMSEDQQARTITASFTPGEENIFEVDFKSPITVTEPTPPTP